MPMPAAGGIVGGLAALALVALATVFLLRRSHNKSAYRSHADVNPGVQPDWPAAHEPDWVSPFGCSMHAVGLGDLQVIAVLFA